MIKSYNRAIKIDPLDALAHNNLGIILNDKANATGDAAEAARLREQAIESHKRARELRSGQGGS